MTVKDLREQLKEYNDNAEVIVVDWTNGVEYYEPTIGGDDEDEYTDKCRIAF